jgi:nucleoside 2-deoxyribosyltransferase
MKAYLANGLFSQADIMYNELIAKKLRAAFPLLELYAPQENMGINDKNSYADSIMIANGDDSYLKDSDFVIAVIDGVEIDSGVACEIGVAVTLGTPVFGLYTDVRQQGRDNHNKIDALIEDATENQFMYRNLYVIGKIKNSGGKVVSSVEELIRAIKEFGELV